MTTETKAQLRFYQMLMKNALDGIHVMDAQGNLIEANDSFCEMLGYTRAEVGSLNIADWNAQWSKAELQARLRAVVGKSARFETVHRRKDGGLIDVEISSTGIDIEGKIYFFASSRDIGERKKYEALMRRHTLVINNSHEGFWGVDQQGKLVEVNQAYADMTGYSVEELLRMHVADLEAIDDMQAMQARVKRIIEQGHELFETRHRHKDGHLVDVEISVSYVAELQQFFAFARDITERKRIEHDRNALALRQQALMSSALEGIHIMDILGNLVEANDTFCHMLGYSREEIGTLNVADWDAQWSLEELMGRFRVLIQLNGARFETRHRRRDGSLIDVEVSTTGVEIDGQQYLFASSHDITHRKQAETDLRIAATAFESQESLIITDANGVILRVNQAFTESTGYAAGEVVGQTPRLLKSGRHDADFYREMWAAITDTGTWQGEIWDRRKNGEVYPKWLTITAVKGEDGAVTHYVGSHTDITERKAAEEKIQQLAFHDPLTRLPNRQLLLDRLGQALASSARSGRQGALLFIDLDNFKTLNDTLGHVMGDLLLQQVAGHLTACVREGDTVARLGGDEFVVMLENLSEQPIEAVGQAGAIGEKILAVLNQPYQLGSNVFRSSGSIGATVFSGESQEAEELLKQADIAMYQAKKAGRNTLRFFDHRMQELINTRAVLEGELHRALDNRQFQLYYQVQADSAGHPLGAEALIRWMHPERGMMHPAQFISLAEETSLILPIGKWVLETACAQLKAWAHDERTRNLALAVNISALQFHQADFATEVQAAVRRHSINPALLKLELTESMLLEDIEETLGTMNALNAIGVRLSLDDFGTGYSSLQYLKRLPLSQLKIDQSFVRDITVDANDAAIVQTIIAMTEALGLDLIAEGVEVEAQREFLAAHGCHAFQGYLFGKPVPIEQFELLLA
ncbi:MAG: PAS domain S-box protein [Sideroxydans sp.]|nr:PAS domain S-box protein [Sideroxydans sp.]